jgi:hypothetical protein
MSTVALSRAGSVSVATSHTVIDGVKDHKLVLVARNQTDRLPRQMTQLGNLVKARSVVRLCSDQLVSYECLERVLIVRNIRTVVGGGASTA